MKTTSISLKRVFDKITKETMLLPYIQRDFVWKKDQITFFLDSMMRGYPIGTFLFWITDEKIYARRFLKQRRNKKFKKSDFEFKHYSSNEKFVVLDGQQRIQSLYLSLIGEYDDCSLFFNLGSNETDLLTHDDGKILYQFQFIKKKDQVPEGFVKTKELFEGLKKIKSINKRVYENDLRKNITNWQNTFDTIDKDTLDENLKTFLQNLIKYELEYIPLEDDDQNQDEILEIFIRTNYGGTKLSYSDLIFSYLKNYWDKAEDNFKNLISDLYGDKKGFKVDNQFLIKTCITLIDKKCEFNLSKINKSFVEKIKTNWKKIENSIKETFDLLQDVYIFNSYYLKSNISIIPIIYSIYYKKKPRINFDNGIRNYIYISTLKNVFSAKPETTVDSIIKQIDSDKIFDSNKILNKIVGENYRIIEDDIISKRARSNVRLILNLMYYKNGNYLAKKFSESNNLDIDHIYPESHCLIYYKDEKVKFNNLLNYCYLSNKKNRKEKLTVPPLEYFEKSDYNLHLLDGKTLFRYNVKYDKNFKKEFEIFKEKRKKLILEVVNNVLTVID